MTQTVINEKIKVYALYDSIGRDFKSVPTFPHSKLKPLSFIWRGKEFAVEELTYIWRESQGETEYYHFAVSDGVNIYELAYNTKTFDWILVAVYYE